jgi:hypothetical protein
MLLICSKWWSSSSHQGNDFYCFVGQIGEAARSIPSGCSQKSRPAKRISYANRNGSGAFELFRSIRVPLPS